MTENAASVQSPAIRQRLQSGQLPRLFLSDVDGTLLSHDKTLTDEAKAAIERLRAAGVRFSLVTGRPPQGVQSLIKTLNINEPMGAFNGGLIFAADGKVQEEHRVPENRVAETIRIMQAHQLNVWLYTAEAWLLLDKDVPHLAHEEMVTSLPPTVVADFTPYFDQLFKVTGVGDDPAAMAACEKELLSVANGEYVAARSQAYYLDVTHAQANKGQFVRSMATLDCISTSDIATIGDMPSDTTMFRASGLSFSMGNATDDVKQDSDYSTASNEENGFAKAVNALLDSAEQKTTLSAALTEIKSI